MHEALQYLTRLFTRTPWVFISWPALTMILGTLVGVVSKSALSRLAVVPRDAGGLVGLVTAPFVHFNFAHLAANLPPFVALGILLLRRGETGFLKTALFIVLGQGILLWCLGRKVAHVGMSGVIFGFFGYLVSLAWFSRTTPDLLVAAGVLLYYGGMLAGVAPARNGTSWEGHLFGLVAGVATAWALHRL